MELIRELVDKKIIDDSKRKELEEIIKSTGKTDEEVIVESKVISEEEFFEIIKK